MKQYPCGFLEDTNRKDTYSPLQIQRYRAKIPGPLPDRIDIHLIEDRRTIADKVDPF